MVEPWIVVPAVAGSNPVGHPITVCGLPFTVCGSQFKRCMPQIVLSIERRDPLSEEALFLLHEAALEARQLYPDLIDKNAPMPTNQPLQPGEVYLVAFLAEKPVGYGALRRFDAVTAEVRRMYVLKPARRASIAREILVRLEKDAARLGYQMLLLETGNRQHPAMALYESYGFTRIPRFGPYVNDPVSVCFSKRVGS
jgi:GNAT superfamily N-acetyltransferase